MKMQKIFSLPNLLWLVLLLLPFSYYPLIALGSLHGVHIDISLLYVMVCIFVIGSIGLIIKNRLQLLQSWPLKLFLAFNIYQTVAVTWSPNPIRGVITALFSWLLFGLLLSIASQIDSFNKKSFRTLLYKGARAVFWLIVLWTLWQIFADALGVTNEFTLLPPNYQSAVFGVARPTGFALEPQFFASILLIPFGWFVFKLLDSSRKQDWFGLVVSLSLILLTLSRGALVAVAVVVIISVVILGRTVKQFLQIGSGLIIATILGGLVIIGAGQLNMRDTYSGITVLSRAVNQVSLGVIDVGSHPSKKVVVPTKTTTLKQAQSGYVSSSTDSRLTMSGRALDLWRESPQHILFGVGSGGFGASLREHDKSLSLETVVNNYYLELLAELGIVGLGLLISAFVILIIDLFRTRQWLNVIWLGGLLTQMLFFSGNANIVHVWVIAGICLAVVLNNKYKHKINSSHKQV